MSVPLTLIVLGQAYFSGTSPNTLTNGTIVISTPITDQSLPQNEIRRPDYTYTPGIGAHKVHTTVTTWVKALKICQDEGGHLAIINSPTEADIIAQVFEQAGPHANSYSPGNAWIGTHDLISQQGDYETIFGESLAQAGYEEWHEPKSTGSAHCGAAHSDGKLSWFHCGRVLGFVCELPYGQPPTGPSNGAYNGVIHDAAWWIRRELVKRLAGPAFVHKSGLN